MDVVDLLITIVVVTILVTIVLAVVTYVAYKLRLSREPATRDDDPEGMRYFVRYDPPKKGDGGPRPNLERLERDVAGMGGHAPEA